MKIIWKLDDDIREDTPTELFDFMGRIELKSNNKKIIDNLINIEEFFHAFVNACSELNISNHYTAEMIYEKYNLIFEVQDSILYVAYGEQQIMVSSKEEFCSAVLISLNLFLKYIKQFFTVEELMRDRIFKVLLSYSLTESQNNLN